MLLTVVIVLCAFFLLLAFLLIPGDSKMQLRAPFWGMYFAHRGLYQRDQSVPENSLAAFVAAVDAGYGIELDLQLSKDGEVVVFHDDDLQRVCGEPGLVKEYDAEKLQSLALFETNQKIPLLREVLQVVDGAVPLILEFKSSGKRNVELCQAAWQELRGYDGDIAALSFDPRIVRWFKHKVPGLLRGQNAAPPKQLGKGLRGWLGGNLLGNFIGRPQFISYEVGDKPLLANIAEGFAMRVCWTAHEKDDLEQLEESCDAIIFEFFEPEPRYKWPKYTPEPDKDADLPDAGDTYYDEPQKEQEGDEPTDEEHPPKV